jgi:transposase
MTRKSYPSDVSREQFELIRPILESARKQTKPRTLDLYEVFCAVLYILKGGIQWRMLPEGFPKWASVYAYFQIWSKATDDQPSVLDECLKKISWRGPYKQWSDQDHQLMYR